MMTGMLPAGKRSILTYPGSPKEPVYRVARTIRSQIADISTFIAIETAPNVATDYRALCDGDPKAILDETMRRINQMIRVIDLVFPEV